MIEYQVVDIHAEAQHPDPTRVKAGRPEQAAQLALGVHLVRSGAKRDLRARVYYQAPGQPMSMVRLYTKAADRTD